VKPKRTKAPKLAPRELVLEHVPARPKRGPITPQQKVVEMLAPLIERLKS
jgi:hypothetical protein